MMNSPYLVVLRFSALLSILGLALTIRHRASGIPDFSCVVLGAQGRRDRIDRLAVWSEPRALVTAAAAAM